jgi:hypothetical protein
MIAASRLQLLLVLVVGALICFAVWRATTRFRALPRAAVRAFALALVLSPGFLVGHLAVGELEMGRASGYETVQQERERWDSTASSYCPESCTSRAV